MRACALWGFQCAYCGDSEGVPVIDHITPLCRGGSNRPANLALACWTCNARKGGRTVEEWMPEEARRVRSRSARIALELFGNTR